MNNTPPFPKLPPKPATENAVDPIHLLTIHLLSIIDILTGKVFVDALPLIGGEEAKQELESWKIGVSEGNDDIFTEKKALSTYTTIALSAFGIGKSAQAHIMKSQADSMKAIYEISNFYHTYRGHVFEFRKTLKSKDLSPMEKLDALWAVTDALYEETKAGITRNAKKDPESLEKVITDLNTVFISLEQLTECAKFINIVPVPSSSSNI